MVVTCEVAEKSLFGPLAQQIGFLLTQKWTHNFYHAFSFQVSVAFSDFFASFEDHVSFQLIFELCFLLEL